MATKVKVKATSKLNSENVLEELKALAMFGGGVVVGALGGKFIDNALKVDTSIPGFNAKALVRPVALLGVGAAGGILLEDKHLKMFATGVGTSGLIAGVKVILKKDLLNGLADFAGLGDTPSIFREPVNLSIERYNPDLPSLSSRSDKEEIYAATRRSIEGTNDEDEISFVEII